MRLNSSKDISVDIDRVVSMTGTTADPKYSTWEPVYLAKEQRWSVPIINVILHDKFKEIEEENPSLNILVPLCGRSPDMLWLAKRGHRIVGIEWVEHAVKRFFEESCLDYNVEIIEVGGSKVSVYKSTGSLAITIYCGDFFAFKEYPLGEFDFIWDNGSICSFRYEKRSDYVCITSSVLKPNGNILLGTFDYEQNEHPFIPFATTTSEITELYDSLFDIELVQEETAETCKKIYDQFPYWNFSRFSWNFYLLTKGTNCH